MTCVNQSDKKGVMLSSFLFSTLEVYGYDVLLSQPRSLDDKGNAIMNVSRSQIGCEHVAKYLKSSRMMMSG